MAVIIFIFGLAFVYIFVKKDPLIIVSSPTNPVISSENAIVLPTSWLPTATLVPTFVYLPTFTPIPSPTPFVYSTLAPLTSTPQQSQSNPIPVNPPSVNAAPDCSPALDYAAAMHKYYLDSIDYIHSPMIQYYQYLLDEGLRNRDARVILEAQRGLDNENAQINAEKDSENKRYKAERASITANCH